MSYCVSIDRIHSQERHQCSQCERSFNMERSLKKHMLSAHAIPPPGAPTGAMNVTPGAPRGAMNATQEGVPTGVDLSAMQKAAVPGAMLAVEQKVTTMIGVDQKVFGVEQKVTPMGMLGGIAQGGMPTVSRPLTAIGVVTGPPPGSQFEIQSPRSDHGGIAMNQTGPAQVPGVTVSQGMSISQQPAMRSLPPEYVRVEHLRPELVRPEDLSAAQQVPNVTLPYMFQAPL